MMSLDAKRFGLAGGIIWAFCMFVCTLLSLWLGYAANLLELLSGIYPGYNVSLLGAFVGLFYGFLDGFIGLWLLAWLYNKLGQI